MLVELNMGDPQPLCIAVLSHLAPFLVDKTIPEMAPCILCGNSVRGMPGEMGPGPLLGVGFRVHTLGTRCQQNKVGRGTILERY